MSQRFKKISSRITSFVLAAVCLVAGFLFFPGEYRADEVDSAYVELGIEDQFVCNTDLSNVRGMWATDDFFYRPPAEIELYTFYYIIKSYSSNLYYCICTNTPLEIRVGSNPYLDIMLNWEETGFSFNSNSCYLKSSDGVTWESLGVFDQLTIGAYDKKAYKYYWTYKFCESNYYTFSATDGNNWNNGKYVYFQPPNLRELSEWNLAEVLNALGIPMPSYYKKGYDYLLYKTGDVYVLECIQDDDFTCYMEYIANANDKLGQGLATRIAPFFSSPGGVIDHRVCLYYMDGAWITYSDDNLMPYDSADPVAQDTIGVDFNVIEDTYDSNWVLYSDFDLYRGGYDSLDLLENYGVPYVMYDVESGSHIEGSTPPSEGGGTGGTSQIPDSSEDDSGSDDDWSGSNLPDDTIDDVGKAEDELFKPGEDIDLDESIKVEINADASSYIWSVIDSFLTNSKVFSFFVTMLSLGIIGLILGR